MLNFKRKMLDRLEAHRHINRPFRDVKGFTSSDDETSPGKFIVLLFCALNLALVDIDTDDLPGMLGEKCCAVPIPARDIKHTFVGHEPGSVDIAMMMLQREHRIGKPR